MEDGTIAYIPVYQTLSTNGVEGLTTYRTISNVKDVVKFYTANVTSGYQFLYLNFLILILEQNMMVISLVLIIAMNLEL